MAVKPHARTGRRCARPRPARPARRVVHSARELFLEQGYPQTTIAAVAARAGVSPDTIYSTIGSKIALLQEVLDVVVGGDDEDVALLDRSGPQAMRAEPDQRRQLAMFAAGITGQLERVRPIDDVLRSAAAVDPGRSRAARGPAAAATQGGDAGRRRLGRRQRPAAAGLSVDDAAAIVWTLTSPEVHRMLRDSSDWSRKRYEDWLATTLVASLLPPDAGTG